MFEEFKHINSSKKEIRKFSRLVGAAFIILGTVLYLLKGNIYYLPFYIGFGLLIIGEIVPIILLPVHKFWMGLSIVLGFISTRVILTLLFYLVLTPIAFFGRLSGKDFLNEKIDKNEKSYWSLREKELNNDSVQKQF